MLEHLGRSRTLAGTAAVSVALAIGTPVHAGKKEGVVVMPLKGKVIKKEARYPLHLYMSA